MRVSLNRLAIPLNGCIVVAAVIIDATKLAYQRGGLRVIGDHPSQHLLRYMRVSRTFQKVSCAGQSTDGSLLSCRQREFPFGSRNVPVIDKMDNTEAAVCL